MARENSIMGSQNDMNAAENTYSGVLGLMKWGTILSLAVAGLVVLLIAA